jgi:tRNA G37 N-methylase Trm5
MKIRKHEVPIVRRGKSKVIAWSIELGVAAMKYNLSLNEFDGYKVIKRIDSSLLFKGKPSRRMLERFASRRHIPKGAQFTIGIFKSEDKSFQPHYLITVH